MQNGKYKVTIEHRITSIEAKVNDIMENHLPHIQQSIEKIQEGIERRDWFLIGILVATVANLVKDYLK